MGGKLLTLHFNVLEIFSMFSIFKFSRKHNRCDGTGDAGGCGAADGGMGERVAIISFLWGIGYLSGIIEEDGGGQPFGGKGWVCCVPGLLFTVAVGDWGR